MNLNNYCPIILIVPKLSEKLLTQLVNMHTYSKQKWASINLTNEIFFKSQNQQKNKILCRQEIPFTLAEVEIYLHDFEYTIMFFFDNLFLKTYIYLPICQKKS